MENRERYQLVSESIACVVQEGWKDVDALMAERVVIAPSNPMAPVLLIKDIFSFSWQKHFGPSVTPVPEDWVPVMLHLTDMLDGNLWSQFYLNSPLRANLLYDIKKISHRIEELKVLLKWNPDESTAKTAKMIPQSESLTEEERWWNEHLALRNALKILESSTMISSYKLYSKGKTPAFTDTQGISRINSSVDIYLVSPKGESSVEFFPQGEIPYTITPEGKIYMDGFGYPFESKSGDVGGLSLILTIRGAMRNRYKQLSGRCHLIPRWGSLATIQ